MKKIFIASAILLVMAAAGIFVLLSTKKQPAAADKKTAPAVNHDSQTKEKVSKQQSSVSPDAITDREDVLKIITPAGIFIKDRLALVHKLPDNLSRKDRMALYKFLKSAENNQGEYVIKNDIMNALRDQKIPPEELTGVLLDLFNDKNQDNVVRAYALQHMRPWYERVKDPRLKQAFYDGLEERNNEMAGGALLALRYLVEEMPQEFDRNLIADKALKIAEDQNSYTLSRISAVQVTAMLNNTAGKELFRSLAADSSTHLVLRLAAVDSLGKLADPGDLALLSRLAEEHGPVAKAANSAIKKINNKNILK